MDQKETRGPWIRTYSGRQFFYWPLDPEDIQEEDVAHHLSLVCRYSGACPYHYSVAQHSVLVAKMIQADYTTRAHLGPVKKLILSGLLHDTLEGYAGGDMPTPMKKGFRLGGEGAAADPDNPRPGAASSIEGPIPRLLTDFSAAWEEYEALFWSTMAQKWGLPDPMPPRVKFYDDAAFFVEFAKFGLAERLAMPPQFRPYLWWQNAPCMSEMAPHDAEEMFLLTWREIMEAGETKPVTTA